MARKLTLTHAIGALAAASLVAGTSSVAFAYFTGGGSGTGTANVGSASPFTITFGTITGGPLLPGSAAETLPYTVTNTGSGTQKLTTTTAAIASSGGTVTHNGTAVAGCLVSWFTVTNTPAASTLSPGGAATGSVAVAMPDASVNQDPCQGVAPDITVTAS